LSGNWKIIILKIFILRYSNDWLIQMINYSQIRSNYNCSCKTCVHNLWILIKSSYDKLNMRIYKYMLYYTLLIKGLLTETKTIIVIIKSWEIIYRKVRLLPARYWFHYVLSACKEKCEEVSWSSRNEMLLGHGRIFFNKISWRFYLRHMIHT